MESVSLGLGLASTPVPLSLPHSPLWTLDLGAAPHTARMHLALADVTCCYVFLLTPGRCQAPVEGTGNRPDVAREGRRPKPSSAGWGLLSPRVAPGGTQLEGTAQGQKDRMGRKVLGKVREGNVWCESWGGGEREAGVGNRPQSSLRGGQPPLLLPSCAALGK